MKKVIELLTRDQEFEELQEQVQELRASIRRAVQQQRQITTGRKEHRAETGGSR